MAILFSTLIIFSLAFLLHFLIWRINLPKKRQTNILLKIFYSVLVFSFFILRLLGLNNLRDYLHIFLFYTSLVLAYIVTYSAVEVDSPSLLLVNSIAKRGKNGLEERDLEQLMTDSLLVIPRIKDLLNEELVFLDQGNYKLTSKGRAVAKIFLFYRFLLGAGKGG